MINVNRNFNIQNTLSTSNFKWLLISDFVYPFVKISLNCVLLPLSAYKFCAAKYQTQGFCHLYTRISCVAYKSKA